MSTSYYGLSSQTADVANANNLTSTGGGSSLAQTTGNQTFDFGGYMEVQSHGGSTGVHGAIGNTDGRGWLLDTAELNGQTIPAGDWHALLTLFTSDVNATGDLYIRFYKLNILGAVYTAIGQAVLTGQTITPAGVAFTLTATGLASVSFASGESLYCDIWWDQTGGGSASTLMSVQVASTASGVAGGSGGFEIQIPAAGPTPITVADSATGSQIVAFTDAPVVTDSATGAEQVGVLVGPPTIPPLPMPLISLNAPAYASNITYAPSRADDSSYGSLWRSVDVPSTGAPVTLTYDLSGVAAQHRGLILVNLLNEQGNQYLDTDFSQASELFVDYTLQGNTAAGGGGVAPSTGWVTLATVTGNSYSTRQHLLNCTGYNWLRLSITASAGVSPNNDISVQMDVHDASAGYMDRWLWLGDSITLEGQLHPMLGGGDWGYGGPICQIVNSETGGVFYPATIDGGNGGQTTAWAATNIAGLLNGFNGGFVSLAFGTNDCNQSFQFTAGDANVTAIYAALLTCIDAALALNNRVIVPYIPYGSNNGGDLGYNANLVNQYVNAHLATDRPTVLRGPDFWTYFNNNPGLIRDGIHPTYTEVGGAASGYEEQHMLWGQWMLANIYQTAATDAAGGNDLVSLFKQVTPPAIVQPFQPYPTSHIPQNGLYEGIIPDGTEVTLSRLNQMAAAGFTQVINYSLLFAASTAILTGYFDRAAALGMKIWVTLHHPTFYNPASFGGNILTVYPLLAAALGATDNNSFTVDVVNLLKNHPACGGYYVADEPASQYHDVLRAHTDLIAATDPNHPRLLVQAGRSTDPTPFLQQYCDCCDALGLDYYPYGDDGLPISNLPTNATALATVAGQYGRRPHVILQAFSWQQYAPPQRCSPWPQCAGFPTLQQMRQERDIALFNMQTNPPDVVWWYSFYNLVQWSDPIGAWYNTMRAIEPILKSLA